MPGAVAASVPMSQVTVAVPVQVPWVDVAETNVSPAGNGSVTTTLVATEGPLFLAVIVYVISSPARTAAALADLVIVKSLVGTGVDVTEVWLLLVSGSVEPPGTVTLAVFVTAAVAFAGNVACNVKVAVPALARFTVVLMLPVPLACPQLDPLEAAHVHDTLVKMAGTLSVTVAPVTGLGPSFVTVIV